MNTHELRKVVIIIFFSLPFWSFATNTSNVLIKNFIIKENLIQNDKLAILTCDSLEKPMDNINGTFQFVMNGFNYALKFQDGVAITPNKIENSTFINIKHKNIEGTISNLFYVLKKDSGLTIYKVNWFYLLIIPIGLFLVSMLFKRFIWLAVVLLGIYLYYNSKKGLNMMSFIEVILDGVKSFF